MAIVSVIVKVDFVISKAIYLKQYQKRHAFITLALENGLDAKDVAWLVGNSLEITYRHYADNKQELFVPEF